MAWLPLPLPGTGGRRFLDTATGENISRRARDVRVLGAERVRARDVRYEQRRDVRREVERAIGPSIVSENKRYWRQRWAEQWAATRRGMTDADGRRVADRANSRFQQLWIQAEVQNFEGGPGSAWDQLARESGAKGGEENEHERSRYLAVIAWYQKDDEGIGAEKWMERGADGKWTYPGMPARVARSLPRSTRHRRGRGELAS